MIQTLQGFPRGGFREGAVNYRCRSWLEEKYVAEGFVLDLEAAMADFKASAGGSAKPKASTRVSVDYQEEFHKWNRSTYMQPSALSCW